MHPLYHYPILSIEIALGWLFIISRLNLITAKKRLDFMTPIDVFLIGLLHLRLNSTPEKVWLFENISWSEKN